MPRIEGHRPVPVAADGATRRPSIVASGAHHSCTAMRALEWVGTAPADADGVGQINSEANEPRGLVCATSRGDWPMLR
jgi:hypothetical protein